MQNSLPDFIVYKPMALWYLSQLFGQIQWHTKFNIYIYIKLIFILPLTMERSKLTIFFQINIKSIKVRRRKNTRPGHIVPDCPFSPLFGVRWTTTKNP